MVPVEPPYLTEVVIEIGVFPTYTAGLAAITLTRDA